MKNVLFWSFLAVSMAVNAYLLINVDLEREKKIKIEVVDVGSNNPYDQNDPEETDYSRGYHNCLSQIYNDKEFLRSIINETNIICPKN
jgi:hypothetical protein